MAQTIKTVPFPDFLLTVPCTVTLYHGLTEDGEAAVAATVTGMCIYTDKARRVYDKDGRLIQLSGTVKLKGDIAPQLSDVSDGTVTIGGSVKKIYAGNRPRNPDGTVHHTELMLL